MDQKNIKKSLQNLRQHDQKTRQAIMNQKKKPSFLILGNGLMKKNSKPQNRLHY